MTYISHHANGPILRKETDVKLLNRAGTLPIQHGRGAGKIKKKRLKRQGTGKFKGDRGGEGGAERDIYYLLGGKMVLRPFLVEVYRFLCLIWLMI